MSSVYSQQELADYLSDRVPTDRTYLTGDFWAFRGRGAQRLAEIAAQECLKVMVPDEELVRFNLGVLTEGIGNDHILLFTKPAGHTIPNAELEQELVVWRANDSLLSKTGITLPF